MATKPTVAEVKTNLIIDAAITTDDTFIQSLIDAAISYAEAYQHLPDGYYSLLQNGSPVNNMTDRTKQAIIMLASHWYESRDAGTGGFFADNVSAAQQSETAVNNLLRLDRNWKV